MADLNKLRQTKEYQGTPWDTSKYGGAYKGIANIHADKHDGDINKDPKWDVESHVKYNKEMNPSKYTKNDLEQAKCSIVEKILKHFDDTLFEMICEEMSNNYLFQSSNYLTEAGYDMFEDEWFEFYHEQHGDILHQVKQSLTD